MCRGDRLVCTPGFNRTALGAVVIEITDDIARHLFVIRVFNAELVVQAMRSRKEIRLPVVCRVVDKRSCTTRRSVDDHEDNTALDRVVAVCRVLVASDGRHAFESCEVGLRFRDSEVPVAMVYLADREFAGKSNLRRFLVFDDQLISLYRGDGQDTAFRIVQVVE